MIVYCVLPTFGSKQYGRPAAGGRKGPAPAAASAVNVAKA